MGSSSREETYCGYCQAHLQAEFERRFGKLVPSPTATQVSVPTPQPTQTSTQPPPPLTAGPTPARHPTLPPPPATPTWPPSPTLPPGLPTNTPQPPATSMPSPTPVPSAYQVTFISEQDGLFHIYRLDESGRSLVRLFTSAQPIYQPSCAPDGQQVAFVLADGDGWNIYVLETETGEVHQITNQPARDAYPAWLPGGQLTFVSELEDGYGIYEVSGTGQSPQLVLHLAAGEYAPAFSSTSDEVAVLADSPRGYEVRLYSLSSGASRQITAGTGVASYLSWSLDGTQLLYTVFGETYAQLRTATRDGTETVITATSVNAAYGVWTPRVGEVIFASDADGDWEIYRMQVEDRLVQPLTHNTSPDLYPMVCQ